MLFLLSERAGLTGSAWGDWALYADSPLRASTQEVLFKGGAGSVDGGSGFSSAPAASSASASVSTTLGVQAPVGYWDPLGLNKNADTATFNRRRAVEIKHGRVAMYATMGYIVPEYYKFPGGELRELCKSRALALRTSGGHRGPCGEMSVLSCMSHRIPVPFSGLEVFRRAEWLGSHLQGARAGLSCWCSELGI